MHVIAYDKQHNVNYLLIHTNTRTRTRLSNGIRIYTVHLRKIIVIQNKHSASNYRLACAHAIKIRNKSRGINLAINLYEY